MDIDLEKELEYAHYYNTHPEALDVLEETEGAEARLSAESKTLTFLYVEDFIQNAILADCELDMSLKTLHHVPYVLQDWLRRERKNGFPMGLSPLKAFGMYMLVFIAGHTDAKTLYLPQEADIPKPYDAAQEYMDMVIFPNTKMLRQCLTYVTALVDGSYKLQLQFADGFTFDPLHAAWFTLSIQNWVETGTLRLDFFIWRKVFRAYLGIDLAQYGFDSPYADAHPDRVADADPSQGEDANA